MAKTSSYESTMLKLEQMTQATNAQQMAWQEKMTKSSHQMEVADLVAAGLNPVLSAGGSGAQSYTTSLDSGANAIANTYSAHESSAATRYAARQSAAATRAAAAANLAAAREAAAASRYAADKGYEGSKYVTDNSKSGSAAGIADNWMKSTKADNEGLFKNLFNSYKDIQKNPNKYIKNNVKGKPDSIYDLTASGRNLLQKTLRQMGISDNLKNQSVIFNATYLGNKKAQAQVNAWITNFYKKSNNAKKIWSSRSGSGIW